MRQIQRGAQIAALALLASSIAFADSVISKPLDGWGMNNSVMAPTFVNNASIKVFNIYYVGNSGGTITYDPATQTLTLTSTITTIKSGAQVITGDFGTVTFTTGPLQSGTVFTSATFAGGTWSITTNGTDGLPNGVLMSGVFDGSVRWRELGKSTSFLFWGNTGGGNMHEISVLNAGTDVFNVSQGATVIPEPTTLALLGTGLAMIGAVRRKIVR